MRIETPDWANTTQDQITNEEYGSSAAFNL